MRSAWTTAGVLLLAGWAHAADGFFVSVGLDEACRQAEQQGKLVFIDFYTTWCVPCKILERTTFVDEAVIKWMQENTVALKLDAEKETRLADRYRIASYPTLLFLKPDGEEVGRVEGAGSAEEFLREAARIREGKDPLTRAKEELAAAGPNDPIARMRYGNRLMRLGKNEEALTEFLWCFDEGNQHHVGFTGVRLSFLLSNIQRLGENYPPAIVALRERRDAAREALLAEVRAGDAPERPKGRLWSLLLPSKPQPMPALDFAALNDALGEQSETLALYDRLRAERPDAEVVAQLRRQLEEQLLAAKRYAEIAPKDPLAEVERIIERHAMIERFAGERDAEVERIERQMLLDDIAVQYQIQVGVGDQEGAARIAARMLELDASPQAYNLLAWHGYLSGKPVEANLAQAQRAYDMTEGRDPAIVDTLARVLERLGRKDEACGVVRTAYDGETEDRARNQLWHTASELACALP